MTSDSQFDKTMRRAWDLKPSSTLKLKSRGVYLVECSSKEEKNRILEGGPWVYRNDLVAVANCASNADLLSLIKSADQWVQFHGPHMDTLTEQGMRLLMDRVGNPISDPIRSNVNGRQFIRAKLQVTINKALRDRVPYTHLT